MLICHFIGDNFNSLWHLKKIQPPLFDMFRDIQNKYMDTQGLDEFQQVYKNESFVGWKRMKFE
jgi:hypothetical protein